MSGRGVKHNFEPGEYVLCFEPDPTKARVLYDAKVLELTCSRDKRGNWKPDYVVHFQGWNSSWDRTVPETFVQKNTAENRALMKRLAMVARNVKKNRTRKRRIDIILRQHFKRKMPPESSDSSSEDDHTDDDDDDADESTDIDDYSDRQKQDSTDDEEDNIDDKDEGSDEEKEHSDGLEMSSQHEIDLDIPSELRAKLEDDCFYLNRRKKLVCLPAEPNVLTILEGYVKNFALNILYGTVEKPRLREQQGTPPEKNIDMCKEVMDGLRVFFDFTLPTILLYECERTQFDELSNSFKPATSIKKEMEETVPTTEVTSPRLRSSSRQAMSPSTSDASPKLPRLSPKTVKREREDLSDEDMPPRRMTRHAYQAEIRSRRASESKSKLSTGSTSLTVLPTEGSTEKRRNHSSRSEAFEGSGVVAVCPGSSSTSESRRRESLRSSSRYTVDTPHSSCGTSASASAPAAVPLSDRVTPPPPLLIPSVISSKASKGSSSPHHTPTYKSRCSTPTLLDQMDKEGVMNSVLAWKLVPEEVLTRLAPTPSVICGAIHLLRLFGVNLRYTTEGATVVYSLWWRHLCRVSGRHLVYSNCTKSKYYLSVRLPALLTDMAVPEAGMKPLMKHLRMLLEYLADNSEELFPDSAYIDASSVGSSSSVKR